MVNTTMEACPSDAPVTRLVCDNQRVLKDAVRSALVRATKSGALPKGTDPERLSRYLLTSLQGLYVTAKTEHDPAILHDIADHMLRVLER
jgi:hypothetical protein